MNLTASTHTLGSLMKNTCPLGQKMWVQFPPKWKIVQVSFAITLVTSCIFKVFHLQVEHYQCFYSNWKDACYYYYIDVYVALINCKPAKCILVCLNFTQPTSLLLFTFVFVEVKSINCLKKNETIPNCFMLIVFWP